MTQDDEEWVCESLVADESPLDGCFAPGERVSCGNSGLIAKGQTGRVAGELGAST
jgi:hypothetical protein